MDSLILFCGISVAFTGLASGVGLLPDSKNATVGETVVFTTSLPPTQTPFVSIAWTFNGSNIITSHSGGNNTPPEYVDRITLFISTGSLELRSVALSDRGEYIVIIIPAVGGILTGTTTLKVYERITNAHVSASKKPIEGSSLNLTCDASGPIFTRKWSINGQELNPSENIVFYDQNRVLSFKVLNRTDSGTYLCELSNPVSSQTAAYTLDVIDPQTSGCAAGCIVGIVCGCIVLVLIVSGTVFYFVRKNKKPQESNTQRDGGGQNNSADQVNYADVKFVRKGGGVVQLASPNQPEYAEVQKRTNRPPSSLPSYSDHMTAGKRQAPTPPTAETEYAGIRLK